MNGSGRRRGKRWRRSRRGIITKNRVADGDDDIEEKEEEKEHHQKQQQRAQEDQK